MSSIELDDQILIVASWAPPTIGGTPTVLRNLMAAVERLGGPQFTILREDVRPIDPSESSLPTTLTLRRPRWLRRIRGGHYVLAPAVFTLVLRRLLRQPRLKPVLNLPDESFALAAALACRFARRRYALYMHNTYAEQAIHPLDKVLARIAEPWLICGARPLLVVSEALRGHYREKYGIESVFVPHAASIQGDLSSDIEALFGVPPQSYVAYTGDVYGMNLDSLQRLQRVLRRDFRGRLVLVIAGPKTEGELRRLGLEPDTVVTGADRKTILALQRYAAAVFAPLAFDSPFPDDVRTAIPSKLVEYFACGSPILVHAPRGTAMAERARSEGWAIVVDEPFEDALAAAVSRVIGDDSFRRDLLLNAKRASAAHDPTTVARTFLTALEL